MSNEMSEMEPREKFSLRQDVHVNTMDGPKGYIVGTASWLSQSGGKNELVLGYVVRLYKGFYPEGYEKEIWTDMITVHPDNLFPRTD